MQCVLAGGEHGDEAIWVFCRSQWLSMNHPLTNIGEGGGDLTAITSLLNTHTLIVTMPLLLTTQTHDVSTYHIPFSCVQVMKALIRVRNIFL